MRLASSMFFGFTASLCCIMALAAAETVSAALVNTLIINMAAGAKRAHAHAHIQSIRISLLVEHTHARAVTKPTARVRQQQAK